MADARPETAGHSAGMAALTLGALGVVFGDIGTSPLYALQAVFAADDGAVKPTPGDVYGIISLVVWSVTLIVSIKFVTFIMRADNDGEGGVMALVGLVRRAAIPGTRVKAGLVFIGLAGVALFYGDGMITPAISVLSAVEGVKVAAPSLSVDRAADRPRSPHRPVRDPAFRHPCGRTAVRPGDDRLVSHARGRRREPPCPPPADHPRDLPEVRGGLLREPSDDRVHLARLRRADRHRRRGAVRRHGPLRPPPDQPRVVPHRLPRADDQLHGPGITDPRRPPRRSRTPSTC